MSHVSNETNNLHYYTNMDLLNNINDPLNALSDSFINTLVDLSAIVAAFETLPDTQNTFHDLLSTTRGPLNALSDPVNTLHDHLNTFPDPNNNLHDPQWTSSPIPQQFNIMSDLLSTLLSTLDTLHES